MSSEKKARHVPRGGKAKPALAGGSPPSTRRGQGRPKAGGAPIGRDEILRAAAELLQTVPVSKLTSAAVASRVGVRPALINYYFTTRSELLVAVVTTLLKELRPPADPARGAGIRDALRSRLAAAMDFNHRFPFVHRLFIDEVLNAPSPAGRAAFNTMVETALGDCAELIRLGVARGEIRPVEPVFLLMALVGMCEFFNSGGAILKYARRDLGPDESAAHYLDFMLDLMMRGLTPPAAAARGRREAARPSGLTSLSSVSTPCAEAARVAAVLLSTQSSGLRSAAIDNAGGDV